MRFLPWLLTAGCLCLGASHAAHAQPARAGELCTRDSDCETGFCSPLAGPRFGLPMDQSVCTEQRCDPISPDAPDWSACSEACPCPEGWGDCDGEADCRKGLSCYHDLGFLASMPDGMDLCLRACPDFDRQLVFDGFCTSQCPCASRQGGCRNDGQCRSGLACRSDVGRWVGLPPGTHVCEPRYDSGKLDWDYCTRYGCDEGEGDCDADRDCKPGLRCVQDIGASFGVRWDFDMCTRRGASVRVRVVHDGVNGSVRMPNGRQCQDDCTHATLRGSEVALRATPPGNGTLVWSGCDRRSGNTCYVTADGNHTVHAYFRPKGCRSPTPYCCKRNPDGGCLWCEANRRSCYGDLNPSPREVRRVNP